MGRRHGVWLYMKTNDELILTRVGYLSPRSGSGIFALWFDWVVSHKLVAKLHVEGAYRWNLNDEVEWSLDLPAPFQVDFFASNNKGFLAEKLEKIKTQSKELLAAEFDEALAYQISGLVYAINNGLKINGKPLELTSASLGGFSYEHHQDFSGFVRNYVDEWQLPQQALALAECSKCANLN